MPTDASTGEAQLDTLEKVRQQRELKFEEKVLMTVLSWQKQAEESQRKKHLNSYRANFKQKPQWSRALKLNICNVSKISAANKNKNSRWYSSQERCLSSLSR